MPKGEQLTVAIENCEYLREKHMRWGGEDACNRWDKAEETLDRLQDERSLW